MIRLLFTLLFLLPTVAQGAEERWSYQDSSVVILAFDTVKDDKDAQRFLRAYAIYRHDCTWGKDKRPLLEEVEKLVFLPVKFKFIEPLPRQLISATLTRGEEKWSMGRWYAGDPANQFEIWVEGKEARRLLVFSLDELRPTDRITVTIGEVEYVLSTVEVP